ncbi:RNA binding motif-containing protein, putative [Eimeria acervulina]|uniref:RNA binding motif-containing protein, putative n=1 Tax=Eimeria acervulina TaxID=5801 RepID=U6GDP2_EIMAC|nr:RNA binding motif-containing protein, putative [Eimeria acervulina]CDI76689.1 RNA binding motif-containing protein, putative [Eimeria acervulina]
MYEGSASPQGAGGGGSLHEGHQAGTQGAPSEGAPEPSVWTPDGGTEPADPPADPGNAPSSCAGGESGTGVSVHPESGGRQADYDRHRNGSSEDNGEQLSFFVGGLHPEVSREELLEYLSGFVTVDEIDIKMDAATGKNRGYAFISVRPSSNTEAFLNAQHIIREKQVDIRELSSKPAPERQTERLPERRLSCSSANRHKIFIGGITSSVTEEVLQQHFEQFGSIEKTTIIRDGSGKSRGFGFVQFTSVDSVAIAVGASPHQLDADNRVDAQPAQDRGARRLPGGRYATSPYYDQGYYNYGNYGGAAGPYGYHAAAAAAYSPMYTPNPYGAYGSYGGYYGGGYGDAYGCAEGGYGAVRRGDEGQSGGASRSARGAPY